jgi:hypothetical protein
VALSRAYLREFGRGLHHNIDKGLLVAGAVEKWFGGGRLVKPMQLVVGDRAILCYEAGIWMLRPLPKARLGNRVFLLSFQGDENGRVVFGATATGRG